MTQTEKRERVTLAVIAKATKYLMSHGWINVSAHDSAGRTILKATMRDGEYLLHWGVFDGSARLFKQNVDDATAWIQIARMNYCPNVETCVDMNHKFTSNFNSLQFDVAMADDERRTSYSRALSE